MTKISQKNKKGKKTTSNKPKFEHLEIGETPSKKEQIEYLEAALNQDQKRISYLNEHYNVLASEYYNCINIVSKISMLDGILIPNISEDREPKPLIELLEELLQRKTASLEAKKLHYSNFINQLEGNQRQISLEEYKKRVNKSLNHTILFHIQRDIFPSQPGTKEMPCKSTSKITGYL